MISAEERFNNFIKQSTEELKQELSKLKYNTRVGAFLSKFSKYKFRAFDGHNIVLKFKMISRIGYDENGYELKHCDFGEWYQICCYLNENYNINFVFSKKNRIVKFVVKC
jgi:hypothetical protein